MLSKDFKEFIQLLNAHEVRYLVIGGYAVAAYGHPRYTKDLDVWLDRTDDNAVKILAALEEFGFGSLGLTKEDFAEKQQIIQLGYPPNRIDLLTYADGLDFGPSYEARTNIWFDETPIDFIGLEQLKKNKKSTSRYQDLADLEALE